MSLQEIQNPGLINLTSLPLVPHSGTITVNSVAFALTWVVAHSDILAVDSRTLAVNWAASDLVPTHLSALVLFFQPA